MLAEFYWENWREEISWNAIPLLAWRGPEVSRKLRLSDLKTVDT
jgi:hypothetical protein